MEKISETAELVANRENLYLFLSRLYKMEVDQPLWDELKEMGFAAGYEEDDLNKGYREMEAYLHRPGPDSLNDLAIDYAKVFLGAGIYENGKAAYPYESVYTSPKKLIMQEARDQVVGIYRARGLDKAEILDFPEDHIALELEFMAYLCHESQKALHSQERAEREKCFGEQLDFITHHLLNWVPEFCADVEKFAETDFYRAVAKITRGYLCMEPALLDDLLSEAGREEVMALS